MPHKSFKNYFMPKSIDQLVDEWLEDYFIPASIYLLGRGHIGSFFSRVLSDLLFYLSLNEWIIQKTNKYSRDYDFNHHALWSFPRSGNHWVRFISEYLTNSPSHGCITNPEDVPIYLNAFPSGTHPLADINPKNPFVLYKSHYATTSTSSIVLLIRNYHTHLNNLGICMDRNNEVLFIYEAALYLELIAAYDCFDGNKMIIYYEDLLTYSEREISRLKYFLNGSHKRYKAFMDNYDYYTELSKQGKNRVWFHSDDHKKSLEDYQKKLTKQDITARKNVFQAFLASKRYQCVKPYLARYE